MNRGQVKRIRKELDRLRNAEKDWEALRLLECEGAVDEFGPEWTELWRGRVRHALRTAPHLEEFLAEFGGFARLPDNPDLRFMKALGRHLDGEDVAAEIGAITGLCAPAETLRRELHRPGGLPVGDQPKLRILLNSFALVPEIVLQKDLRRLGTLLAPFPVVPADVCESFAELLTRARQLNGATAVKRKVDGVTPYDLCLIDEELEEIAPKLPGQLFDLLAAPVLAQVAAALRRVADIGPDHAARLALSAPFCMEKLAGPAWPALSQKFRMEAGQLLSPKDRVALCQSARNAGFEERFKLVNRVVALLENDYEPDPKLQDALALLYKGIFNDLTGKKDSLPERERRRLAAVVGPVFSRHLPLLWSADLDLPYVLDAGAAAGCLDGVCALIHAFFAVIERDRGMTANARAMLKLLPPIGEEAVLDLFRQYQEVLIHEVEYLPGLLQICRESGHELDQPLAKGVLTTLLSLLVMNTLSGRGKRNGMIAMFMDPLAEETSRACKKLLKGLPGFAGNAAFLPAVELANGFPTGRINGVDLRRVLRKLIDSGGPMRAIQEMWVTLLSTIYQADQTQDMDLPFDFGSMLDTDGLTQEVLVAGLEELCGDPATVALFDAAGLKTLFAVIRQFGRNAGMGRHLLLVGNAAAILMQAGDEEMGKLHADIMNYLAAQKKTAKKRGRR